MGGAQIITQGNNFLIPIGYYGPGDYITAIQSAINAAGNLGGGEVRLAAGLMKLSAGIVNPFDSVGLTGSGFGTILQPVAGANFDVISNPIPPALGTTGFVRNYQYYKDFMIDCSLMSGTTQGQGNGIHSYGLRYSKIRNLYIKSCKNWAILGEGDNTGPGNNFSYDNQIDDCVFDLCNANIWGQTFEACDFRGNRFKWAGAGTAALQPSNLHTQDQVAQHLRVSSGYCFIGNGNVFGKGGTYTTEAILLSNSGPCRVIGNRFDQPLYQAIKLQGGNHIFAHNQVGSPGSAAGGVFGIQIGSSNNKIMGNTFDTTAGAMLATYAIGEAGGPFTGNVIDGNELIPGVTGVISQNAGSTNSIGRNPGYNPVGHAVAQPAVPASTVNATNNSGVDCEVYIIGGAVTVVTIGGVATGFGATPDAVRVPAGQTINLTYTVAPTWQWFGD